MKVQSTMLSATLSRQPLERLGGAYLGQKFTSHQTNVAVEAVDLSGQFKMDAFRQQNDEIFGRLLGAKGVRLQRMVGHFIPEEKITQLQEMLYERLARWAEAWAKFELAQDERFTRLKKLSDEEKSALIEAICDQNRALAALGGVSGFLGLKGVVVDTAWLLLVSLKSIYQLALVYQVPLTDKAGIRLAYGILGGAKLDKLQEKQVLMTALALGDQVLKNAHQTSIVEALKNLGDAYQNTSYEKSLDELTKYVNLDRFNPKWLHWLLPVGSSAVSSYYNVGLIETVFAVAQATFLANQPKLLLTDGTNA